MLGCVYRNATFFSLGVSDWTRGSGVNGPAVGIIFTVVSNRLQNVFEDRVLVSLRTWSGVGGVSREVF